MFKHILVPLDGSIAAEAVLPAAAYLAHRLHASVTLIHVAERQAPAEIHGDRHLTDPEDAYAYLRVIKSRFFHPSLEVNEHVHLHETLEVAATINDYAEDLAVDLIVMTTHGRGGLRHRLFGSRVQELISLGSTPIFLTQPANTSQMPLFICRRLLVPLDGQPAHERGLPLAANLAQNCHADIYLILVVPTVRTLATEQAASARLLPGTSTALLELDQQHAKTYLNRWVSRLQATGHSVSAQVGRGDPAAVIRQTARRIEADLIVLTTHGKQGSQAFWAGSVSPKIANQTHRPLLLVPVSE